MVAVINNILAGAGIALLARWLLGDGHTPLAVLLGVIAGLALTTAFLAFQKWRFGMFETIPQAVGAGRKPSDEAS